MEIKGPPPSSLFLESFYSFVHMLDFIWPSNDPLSYLSIILALLRGWLFLLWSYRWACHQKDVILHIIFIVGALLGIIRPSNPLVDHINIREVHVISYHHLDLGYIFLKISDLQFVEWFGWLNALWCVEYFRPLSWSFFWASLCMGIIFLSCKCSFHENFIMVHV